MSRKKKKSELIYVCSPLSAPTRAETLANAATAVTYMVRAEHEFGSRAVAPHAYLPYLLDDTVSEQRALALEFGQKLLGMCWGCCKVSGLEEFCAQKALGTGHFIRSQFFCLPLITIFAIYMSDTASIILPLPFSVR